MVHISQIWYGQIEGFITERVVGFGENKEEFKVDRVFKVSGCPKMVH